MLEEIKALIRREPFQPFRIITSSGNRYEVINPFNLAIGQSQLSYFFPASDRWVLIRLNQITELESASAAA